MLRFRILASILGCMAVATLVLVGCSNETPQDEVWIIGLDGADWDILDPMIAAGDLPHLAALRAESSYGRLRSDQPMLSPILWTSLATGKTADQHGVTWFMTDGPDGEKIPISSRNRRVRALWNILSEAHQSVGIIGWWATWPVEPVEGFLVSDYVGWHSFGVTGTQLEVPGKVWPSDWQSWVTAAMPDPEAVDDALLQTMVHLPAGELGFDPARGAYGGPLPHLRQAVATARGYTDVALEALRRQRPRLLAVYYEGTDAVEHLFGQYMPPQQAWVGDEDFAAFQDAVRGYWRYQDELLGELLAQRTDRTTVVVISDHGFRQGTERLKEERFEIDRADASHMSDGIVLLAGPSIPAGQEIRGASIYDVTPTVLALLGLPAAEDMAGRPLSIVPPLGVDLVSTYETGAWDRGDDMVVDPESGRQMEEMLRSLGYISGSSSEDDGSVSADAGMTVENAVNLAVVYKRQGRYDEAIAVLDDVLREHPTNFEARRNLAQIQAESGNYARAEELYQALLAEQPESLELVEDYGLTLGHAGKTVEAAEVFRNATRAHPEWARGWAHLGFALFRAGDREGAEAAIRRSLATDERDASAHYYRGALRSDAGDLDAAASSFERALQLDPTYEDAVIDLVSILRSRGQFRLALDRLRSFEDRNGPSQRVLSELGAVYLESNQPAQALEVLSDAASRYPSDAPILSNLGMAQALTNDIAGARRSFERLLVIEPDSPDAHTRMGNLQAQIGNLTAAMREWKRALEIEPRAIEPALSLATLYHRQSRLDEAIALYERVIAADENNATAIYQMAMAVGASGDETRARELLARARRLDPTLPIPGQQ